MWDLRSLTRDWTHVLSIERQILHHWTRKVPWKVFKSGDISIFKEKKSIVASDVNTTYTWIYILGILYNLTFLSIILSLAKLPRNKAISEILVQVTYSKSALCLFSASVTLFLCCKEVHPYHFSRFHIQVVICDICFSLSDFLHSVWQSLGLSMSLQMALFHSFSKCLHFSSPEAAVMNFLYMLSKVVSMYF